MSSLVFTRLAQELNKKRKYYKAKLPTIDNALKQPQTPDYKNTINKLREAIEHDISGITIYEPEEEEVLTPRSARIRELKAKLNETTEKITEHSIQKPQIVITQPTTQVEPPKAPSPKIAIPEIKIPTSQPRYTRAQLSLMKHQDRLNKYKK